MNCPKCELPLIVRPECFYWRGTYFTGLICVPCNSLWDNPEDSFTEYVIKCAKENPVHDPYE